VRSDLQRIDGISEIETDVRTSTCKFKLSNTSLDLAATLNEFARTNSHIAGWSMVNVVYREHGICGPWGCGPTPQTLTACHLSWLVLLTPPGLLLSLRLSWFRARIVALSFAGLGTLGLAAVVSHNLVTWLPQADDWQRRFFVQRCLFSTTTLVEVPIAEVLVLGLVMWAIVRGRRTHAAPAESLLSTPGDSK
jgi:hypothetical protein